MSGPLRRIIEFTFPPPTRPSSQPQSLPRIKALPSRLEIVEVPEAERRLAQVASRHTLFGPSTRKPSKAPRTAFQTSPAMALSLEASVEALLDQSLPWAQTLVRIPSVSGTPATRDVIDAARRLLGESAVCTTRLAAESCGAPVLVAHAGSTDPAAPSMLLSGHIDVVPPAGMENPWSGDVKDGRLLGRGSTDMKGGAAAALAAFAAASRQPLRGSLWLMLSTDEETNVNGVRTALEEPDAPKADIALIAEPTELEIHDAHRGDAWVKVEFTGRSAHSSRPHLGVNAIEAAALFIVRARKRLPEMMLEGPAKGPQTCSIDLVRGGAAENVVAEHCEVIIDFRYQGEESGPLQEARILRAIEECRADPDFPKLEVKTTITGDWPALVSSVGTPTGSKIVRALEGALGRPIEVTPMSGWGEGGYFNAFGIPAFYFGPGEGRLAHTPQESCPADSIPVAAKAIYAAVMSHLA